MRARIQMCQRKGFAAVDFDNVDGYRNDTGFPPVAETEHTDILLTREE